MFNMCVVSIKQNLWIKRLKIFFVENEIVRETSCVDTSQQNEHVEQKNRHLCNVACALKFQDLSPFIL